MTGKVHGRKGLHSLLSRRAAGPRRRALCALGAAVLVLPWFVGCNLLKGLVGTEIVVARRYETLEDQVLGSFDSLEHEVYVLAGVRSVDPLTGTPKAPAPLTESKRRALEARRSMEFNRDDVLLFKRRGYVGESSEGMLMFFDEERDRLKATDARLHGLVDAIVAEENRDRMVIMERTVQTTPALRGQEGLRSVQRILAKKYRREAEPGMKVQLPDGTWAVKEQEAQ